MVQDLDRARNESYKSWIVEEMDLEDLDVKLLLCILCPFCQFPEILEKLLDYEYIFQKIILTHCVYNIHK